MYIMDTKYSVSFTSEELTLLRDLMSTVLNDGATLVSSAIAEASAAENNIEPGLWKKVRKTCRRAGVVTGKRAPDYVIAINGQSPVSVFKLHAGSNDIVKKECV